MAVGSLKTKKEQDETHIDDVHDGRGVYCARQ